MKDVVFHSFNTFLRGVDFYELNGNLWLIMTEEKEWVIELRSNGTLWYNFYFFENILKHMGMDVYDTKEYITEYLKDILKTQINELGPSTLTPLKTMEYIMENGIKEVHWRQVEHYPDYVDNILKNMDK